MPPTLSQRHLLKCAQQTHLYCLEDRNTHRGVLAVLCLPDGNTLVTGGLDDLVHVWDLKSKRLLRSFPNNDVHGGADCLYYVSGRIVVGHRESRTVNVWTLDGRCLLTVGGISLVSGAACGHDLLCFCSTDDNDFDNDRGYELTTLDVFSGETSRPLSNWNQRTSPIWQPPELAVFDNIVVVLCPFDYDEEVPEDSERNGIFLLDRSRHYSLKLFQQGDYVTMAVSDDNSFIATLKVDGIINIFSLTTDRLVLRHTLGRPSVNRLDASWWDAHMLIHGRKLYMSYHDFSEESAMKKIDVFDLSNGSHEKVLLYHGQDPFADTAFRLWDMATNGRELFCAFNIGGFNLSRFGIRAYPM
jgi:WD40 repeat protein